VHLRGLVLDQKGKYLIDLSAADGVVVVQHQDAGTGEGAYIVNQLDQQTLAQW
jgi:hypothetical protein